MVNIEKYTVGILKTNCYLIEDLRTGEMAIVDPGSSSKELSARVDECKNKIKYILLTHGHFDHIQAVKKYKDITKSKLVAYKGEETLILDPDLNLSSRYVNKDLGRIKIDILLSNLDKLMLGETEITLIHTPGHTSGSCCYIIDDNIISGDTLFRGDIGRTDLATGNYDDMMKSLKMLADLEGDYKVYPGHGKETTLDFERQNNNYFKI